MMSLKEAFGPAFLAGISVVPTYLFGEIAKDRFMRSYQDAGLLQTSQLDGWDTSKPTSVEKREEFRKWLVDCHKASYVPICLSGSDNFLTAEPSVVVPIDRDEETLESEDFSFETRRRASTLDHGMLQSHQRGAVFTRVAGCVTPSPSKKPQQDFDEEASRTYSV